MQHDTSTRKRSLWLRYGFIALATALVVAPLAAYASDTFTDVPDTNIFHDDINWMADNGITAGCGGGGTLYCPKDNVTREQMSAFMKRLAVNQVVDAATALEADNADTLDGLDSTELTSTGYLANTDATFVDVPASSTTDVMTLDLPAGTYLINARASMNSNSAAAGRLITCTLTAGTTSQTLENFWIEPNGSVDTLEVTFMIAHTFAADGQAVMSCTAAAGWSGNILDPTISAVSVNEVLTTVTGTSTAADNAN